jgi:hypothetical protein
MSSAKAPLLASSSGPTDADRRRVPRPKRAAAGSPTDGHSDSPARYDYGTGSNDTGVPRARPAVPRPPPTRQQAHPAGAQQQQQYQVTQYNELDLEEHLARERNAAIREIEAESRAVREVYADVHRMVIEQQKPLDTAEGNIDHAADKVDKGNDELVEARRLQTKARKKMLILFCIVFVIIIVVVIVVVVEMHNNDKSK